MSKFTDNNYKPGKIYSTKDYDQFKTVVGNRPVNITHVNRLIEEIARENLLESFPAFISSDGYMLDGQHRLKAAKANDLEYFFTVSSKTANEHSIGFINSAQKLWTLDDFVHFYAENGNAQYQFLEEQAKKYNLTSARLIALCSSVSALIVSRAKKGLLHIFTTEDEKQYLSELLDAYVALKSTFPVEVWGHYKFMGAIKSMFKQVSVEDINAKMAKYPGVFEYKRTTNEYLRQFEDIFNKFKREGKSDFYRFF